MNVLHIMVGLPRSGKSSWALKSGFPIVSPDAIRLSLHGTEWKDEAEPMVWAVAHTMVESLFMAGHQEIVLDACNITAALRHRWESPKWACVFHVIRTPKDECIKRAVENGKTNLVPVIERMAAVWNHPGMGEDC